MTCLSQQELLDLFWELPDKERRIQFLGTKEVAKLLCLSDSRIRQLAEEGGIPGIKILGRIHIHLPSLKAQLKMELSKS